MPRPLTPKQEKFAQVYVETGNASEAYRQAYDVGEKTTANAIHVSACKLLASPNVTLRVDELQEAARRRHNVTLDSITRELDEDRKLARENGQASAAVSATMGKAKLHGLIVDKQEQRTTLQEITDQPMSEDYWSEEYADETATAH